MTRLRLRDRCTRLLWYGLPWLVLGIPGKPPGHGDGLLVCLALLLAACWLLHAGMLVGNLVAGRWGVAPLNLLGLGLLAAFRVGRAWRLRLWLALRLFWLATLLCRWLQPERGWPPWLCFYVALPLVRSLCRLACWVGPKGEEER